jgi:hypothetical protein
VLSPKAYRSVIMATGSYWPATEAGLSSTVNTDSSPVTCKTFLIAGRLAGPALRGQQHVHPGRVAELDAGHVHDQLDGRAGAQRAHKLGMEPRRGIEVDLAGDGHDRVITLRLSRNL